MVDVEYALRAAGIWSTGTTDLPAVSRECARLVRRMRERLVRDVGLVPAGDDVAVPAVALALGFALADTSTVATAVVDATASWACARELVQAARPDGKLLARSWLREDLAVLTPRIFDAGAMLRQLHGALVERGEEFDHLVVDLTGFDHLGEQLAAFELLDGVAVVARSKRSTTRQIQRWLDEIPGERSLGVLLTGL